MDGLRSFPQNGVYMKTIEIFLSKLDDSEVLYSKISAKLEADDEISCRNELIEKLSAIEKPSEVSVYVSDEDITNEAVDEILAAFREASDRNVNLEVTVTEDEFLNLMDDSERITSDSKPRSLVHRDGDLHPTVHVWIAEHKDMGVYVLLQKRSVQKLLHPDCYDVSAAGHVTQGGEFREAAVRELSEELGLEVSPQGLEFLGMVRNSVKSGDMLDNELSAVYLCNKDVEIDSLMLQASEVSDVCWAEIDEILTAMKHDDFKNCISAKELEMIKKVLF